MEQPQPQILRRRVFALAGPVIAENFLETSLGIVDTLLVANLWDGDYSSEIHIPHGNPNAVIWRPAFLRFRRNLAAN